MQTEPHPVVEIGAKDAMLLTSLNWHKPQEGAGQQWGEEKAGTVIGTPVGGFAAKPLWDFLKASDTRRNSQGDTEYIQMRTDHYFTFHSTYPTEELGNVFAHMSRLA